VPPGSAPSPDTEVVIVKSGGRIMDITLRGRSATPEKRTEVRRVLERLPQLSRVLDAADLKALRAGDKLGDFVVEARAPWGFGLAEPEEGASRGGHGSTREMRRPQRCPPRRRGADHRRPAGRASAGRRARAGPRRVAVQVIRPEERVPGRRR
jgi:hypothetical protein